MISRLLLSTISIFFLFSSNIQWRTCTRVIDGDTLVLDGQETIRLIGVDSPDIKDPRKAVQYFGQEAYEFTKTQVEGKRVRLDYDWEKNDKYGRTLAYVFLEDGTMLNSLLILRGYGIAYKEFRFKYLDEFESLEKMAKEWKAGLWANQGEGKDTAFLDPAPQLNQSNKANIENITVYITKSGKKYHKSGCSSLKKSSIPIFLKDACAKGYTPCSLCSPPPCKLYPLTY